MGDVANWVTVTKLSDSAFVLVKRPNSTFWSRADWAMTKTSPLLVWPEEGRFNPS